MGSYFTIAATCLIRRRNECGDGSEPEYIGWFEGTSHAVWLL